jgi:hypothetical protein
MQMKPSWRKVCLLGIIVCLNACTTMRSIPPLPKEVNANFEIGDVIKVYTKDDTIITFKVVEITSDTIVGAREKIPFTEVIKVEKEELSVLKTTAMSGSVALSTYGTLVLAGLLSWIFLF